MTIANASSCDDLAFDSVFDLRDEAALTESEERPATIIKAEAAVRTMISNILDKPVLGGARTRAAKQPLGRLHSHVKDHLKSLPIDDVIPLLRSYAPVFRSLFSQAFDPFAEHTLQSEFSYPKPAATAIAAALSRRM